MNANDKNGLGCGTQMDEMSNKFETDSENSFSIFDGRSSDEDFTSANDRSSKAEGYKVVPPPITGNFLTPRADISFAGLDEYAIRNKIIESQTTKLNTKTSETVESVIMEDGTPDDEEEGQSRDFITDHAVGYSGCLAYGLATKLISQTMKISMEACGFWK
ncbi:hypothetical protein Tco_0597077 [Tanacetum coccineum]